jgi:uncharacterized Zn-binding protein involved in type VI secretion
MSTGVAILGSTSSHGGSMISASGSKFQTPQGAVCADGDLHSCPIPGHGTTAVTGNSTRATVGGKKVVLSGAVAGCGAIINGNFASNWALS